MIEYEKLKTYSDEELEELNQAAVDELYNLQLYSDAHSIAYWSQLSHNCKAILKERKNG